MLRIKTLFVDGGRVREGYRYCTVDSPAPVFSWAVASSASENAQSACRLTVDGYFDSGWVETTEQSMRYGGEPLPAGQVLTVSVTVRDRCGEESEPHYASFVSGVLSEDEVQGEWIGVEEDTNGSVLYFRKDLTLSEMPISACLYVCGLGYHHVTVGGLDITDAKLEPAHANYAKNVYYTVHPDMTSYLEVGHNVIGIKVAEGWRNNYSDFSRSMLTAWGRKIEFEGKSQLWAMLDLHYADGRREVIATDGTWGVKRGAITDASIFNGETYDARLRDKDWNTGDEGIGFKPVTILPAPGGVMQPMALEPIRQVAEYPAIDLTTPKKGMYVADFGQNLAGVVRIVLPEDLHAGQTITLRFAEELNEDGTLYTEPLRAAKCTDTYIASGDSRDLMVWEPRFTYHGFRYCEITGVDFLAKEDLTALLWCTDLKNKSFFTCGSALVNQIQKNIVMTEMDNMHSILTDCPQRDERMGWMNDATVRFEETPYNFDIGRMFPKIVRDIRAEQREEGQFTCCCPFYFGGLPADPVCSSYLVAAYEAWLHTGNLDIIAEGFDGFAAWEDFLLSRSDDYIVNYSHYGDWAAPVYACQGGDIDATHNIATEGILMSTGYSYLNCRLLAQMATLIGRADRAAQYSALAEQVRKAFLTRWFDPATAKVGIGSMGSQAFALWLEILPEESRQAAAQVMADDLLAKDYQFTTGNLCTKYLLDMLAKYGYVDVAWSLLHKQTYPSWGYMIQNEATTIWERFELKKNPGMNSHNHPMYGAIGYFFYAYIAGVTPLAAGWERIRIAPAMPEGLLSAQAVVDTVRGDVSVRWAVRYGKRYLFLQIPFGVTAEVAFGGKEAVLGSGYHVLEA